MRTFACPRCGQLVYFENDVCLRCRSDLGFDPHGRTMVLVTPEKTRCVNRQLAGCNWVLPPPGGLCRSCRLTRTRPSDAALDNDPRVAGLFVSAEAAKRRLVFQLLELELPLVSQYDESTSGLAFDFLTSRGTPITIGHADGVVTIDLAESDDVYRERMRTELSEVYRTMLGHLRHEVGHYYWQILVQPHTGFLERFRALFGDERADYELALQHHYHQGPPARWADEHVSAYAAAHPWEDWAETWAHYLHIRDTMQTAASHGVIVSGPRSDTERFDPKLEPSLIAAPSVEAEESLDDILDEWFPLTYALNAINRSMGKDDLYPFVLSPKAIEKLSFVHRCQSPG